MSQEPTALRLAKWLDAMPSSGYALSNQAAAELRSLYEEVTEQARLLGMSAERELALLAKIDRLEKQLGEAVWNYGEKVRANQELLEALKLADALLWGANMNAVVVERKVKAAIAKGEQA